MSHATRPPGRHLTRKNALLITAGLVGVLLTVAVVTWFNLPWRADMTRMPPDSGFYAYIGKAILRGQVLYRDVWDDKPPVGYYLNALELAIFGQSPWGVWWSSIFWISGCSLLFFTVFKRLFGWMVASLATLFFLAILLNPELFQGGNLMEIFALAPQIGIIGIAYLYFTSPHKTRYLILAGILTGVAYLIKQPTIALGCSVILLIAIKSLNEWKFSQSIRNILGFGLGSLITVVVASVYWLLIGAFSYFLDGGILQGFSFIGGSETRLSVNFFYTIVNVLPKLLIGRLYIIALFVGGIVLFGKLYHFWLKPIFKHGVAWWEWCLIIILALSPIALTRLLHGAHSKLILLGVVSCLGLYFLIRYYQLQEKSISQAIFTPLELTWLVGFAALPLELLMASLGGRYFGHYFITMIPSLLLVASYPMWKVISLSMAGLEKLEKKVQMGLYSLLVVLILITGFTFLAQDIPADKYIRNLTNLFNGQIIENDLEKYILQTTEPGDKVLVWHIHLGINFVTDRQAPSRFLFPLNLFIPPSAKNVRLEEYINDLEIDPPELILVQKFSSIALPFVDQPLEQECQSYCTPEFVQALEVPQIKQQWLRFQEFFNSHYVLDTRIYDWMVYRSSP